MTTTASGKAASNGSTADREPKRLTGMARVLESETWRLASNMHDAVFEAQRLCNEIYHTVYDAYQPQGDSTAAQVAATTDIQAKADEARRLMQAAVTYLNALTGADKPPF